MKLSDVARLLSSIPFRSRIESEADGVFLVIQARDLGSDGLVQQDEASRVRALPGARREHLEPGDVLLQPRGTRFPAARFESGEMPAVAAAPLLILRPDTSRLVPEFLVAILGTPSIQAALRQAAVGTYVPQVPRQVIADLHIELPDIPSQMRLADLVRLERQEAELMDRLRETRARYFDLAVREVAKKTRKRGDAPGSNSRPVGAVNAKGAMSNSLERKV